MSGVAEGRDAAGLRVLVYAPYSFSGRGPAQSCALVAGGMVRAGARPEVHVGRARRALPPGVVVREPVPLLARAVPWRYVERPALRLAEKRFRGALATADPATTVAHFWPGSPVGLVRAARDRGLLTVREMVNCACATSAPILDAAYARLGLAPTHLVTPDVVEGETRELAEYDLFFASNPEVERSLLALGVETRRILPTTFGWEPARFADVRRRRSGPFRAVFVGRVGVRKGVPELLEAWASLDVDGELLLAGSVDDEVTDLVAAHARTGRVRVLGYVDDPAAVYAESDVFVFPTLEEGGPQVTYEAAACGLPVVTTPMGAARLVEDGRTGCVVDPGAPEQIAAALRRLALDAGTREAYGAAARAAAQEYAYERVGARRAGQLARALAGRGARRS